MDGMLGTDNCHVFDLFLLIFLGWVGGGCVEEVENMAKIMSPR